MALTPTLIYRTERAQVWHADIAHPPPTIDAAAVVTSPPYNVGLNYGPDLDDAVPWADYVDHIITPAARYLTAALRVESGRCWLNAVPTIPDRPDQPSGPRRPLAAAWLSALLVAGLNYRDVIAWTSQRGTGTAWGSWRRPSAPNLRGDHETILVCHAGDWRRHPPLLSAHHDHLDPNDAGDWQTLTSNVWSIPPARRTAGGHPAPFPLELPARAIRLSTWPDELVLDPFAGSGTTGLAALRLGRRFAGFDADRATAEAMAQALAAEEEAA